MSLLLTLGLGSSGAAPTPSTGGDTPYMNMLLPTVSVTLGPLYATEVNAAFFRVDGHDHSPGFGKLINTAGLQLDADLSFHGFSAKNLDSSQYNVRSPSAGLVGQVYFSGKDLYCVDGAGTVIQITAAGAVNAGTTGNWAGLTPPAEAGYNSVTKTFSLKTNTTGPKYGFLAVGDILLQPADPSTSGIFTQLRAAGVASYTFVFPQNVSAGAGTQRLISLKNDGTTVLGPAALPGSTLLMRMDSNGVPYADVDVDGSTIVLNAGSPNKLGVKAQGITGAQIANGTVTSLQRSLPVQNSAQVNTTHVNPTNIGSVGIVPSVDSVHTTTNARPILIVFGPRRDGTASQCRVFGNFAQLTFTLKMDGSSSGPGTTSWTMDSFNNGSAQNYAPWASLVIPPGAISGGVTHNWLLTINNNVSDCSISAELSVTEL